MSWDTRRHYGGENSAGAILEGARTLLMALVAENGLEVTELVSVVFTATPDLDAVYPAAAAREMGWTGTPLLCMQEMVVQGSLARCIRVLIHWNTDRSPAEIRACFSTRGSGVATGLDGGGQ